MNFLDVRTVIFSQMITNAVCTVVLAFLWRRNRKRFAGTAYWLLDFACQTTALLLVVLRGSIPDWISVVVANTLVIAGALLGYVGLARFVEKKSPQIHNYVLLAAFAAVHWYFVVHPDLAARNFNLSSGLLIVCGQCVWLLLRRVEHKMRRMTRDVGLVFGGYCLVSLVRMVVVLVSPPPTNDFFQSGLYDTPILMVYQLLFILLTFALTLMVNQRLHNDLQTQEEKFATAFRSSPYALTLTRLSDGQILEVNDSFVALTGYASAEVIGKTTLSLQIWDRADDRIAMVNELGQGTRILGKECQFRNKSGERLTGLLSTEIITIDDEPWILSGINDITARKRADAELEDYRTHLEELVDQRTTALQQEIAERKRAEQRQQVFVRILDILNQAVEPLDVIRNLLEQIKAFTGFEAVGIRLRDGEDFPYYETLGFPAEFVEAERYLCARDQHQELIRDSQGKPYVECMCGNVLCGRTQPTLPFFTEGGSFWSNHTTALLASTTDADRQTRTRTRTRNRCNGEGYESVALIPLRSQGQVIGLLQLNDRRIGMLTLDLVQFFENVGLSIGFGFARQYMQHALRESETRYRTLFAEAAISLWEEDLSGVKQYIETLRATGITDFRAYFTDHPDAVLECAARVKVLEVNKSTLTLYQAHTQDELFRNFESIFCTESVPGLRAGFCAVAEGRTWCRHDALNRRLTGEPCHLIVHWTVVPGYEATYARVLVSVFDLTERKRAEEALRQAKDAAEEASRAKSQFLANLSHDLRTPLNSILSYAQLFRQQTNFTETQQHGLAIVQRSGEHLLAMINDLLDFSTIEAGKMRATIRPFHLRQLLDTVTESVRRQVELKGIWLICDYAPDLPATVCGDDLHLHQILLNLLSNAIKFTEQGRVTLRILNLGFEILDFEETQLVGGAQNKFQISNQKSQIRFEVEDTGIGIPADQLDAIFAPFHQMTEGMSKPKGIGLGLTISRHLARLMQSDIYVRSTTGQGSVFWFDLALPVVDTDHPALSAAEIETLTIPAFMPTPESERVESPPLEDVAALYELARIGNIMGLRNRLARLEASDPRWQPFVKKLKILARDIKLQEIRADLHQYLQEEEQ